MVVTASGATSGAGGVDVYPLAGTTTANPATQISFRGATTLRGLSVTGSRTGRHAGRFAAHSDGHGVSFLPKRQFREGERVTVRSGSPELTGAGANGAVRFRILTRPTRADREALPMEPNADPGGTPPEAQSFRSRPDLRPPDLDVISRLPGASSDAIFIAPKAGPGQDGPMIVDARGRLIWFRRVTPPLSPFDFRAQAYRGRPVLTWWEGRVLKGKGRGHGVMLDSSYQLIKRVVAGNGFAMDEHEFKLTRRGTALVTAYEPVRFDLRSISGPRDGYAWDCIVQEVDIATGLVMFEWHSLAHVGLRLSVARANGRASDPFHVNSIEVDEKRRLLLSSRNTNTVFQIDRHTGRVVWRLGGRRSSFEMGPGTTMIGQHDARHQHDGTITAFDNGGHVYPSGREARGVRLRVNPSARTVRLVSEYRHPGFGRLLAPSQGSMQELPSGNVFLTWGGGNSYLTELAPDGSAVFEASIEPDDDDTYRAYRLPWRGARPERSPEVSAISGVSKTDVYASWNGATGVAQWVVLAGPEPGALKRAGAADREGFETHIELRGLAPRYVRMRALDRAGHVIGTSAAVRPRATGDRGRGRAFARQRGPRSRARRRQPEPPPLSAAVRIRWPRAR